MSACACVSTSRSWSRTTEEEATVTGSAVPVTSVMMPGVTAPAPREAACSSPVPTITAHLVERARVSAAVEVNVPAISFASRISPS